MNRVDKVYLLVCSMAFILLFSSCRQDLTEINTNPNEATEEIINPSYILTSALAESSKKLSAMAFTGTLKQRMIPEAMQYLQRDFLEYSVVNQFSWYSTSFDERDLYKPASYAAYLETRAVRNVDSLFIKGTALTLQAMWFGLQTSNWGDVPYSEANKGSGNFQPEFDTQKDVFLGILEDLEYANSCFADVDRVSSSVLMKGDILFNGDVKKWQQFANSLRIRYLMRLSEKKADLLATGFDIQNEFKKMILDPTTYPLITKSADNASISFPGRYNEDSWPLGNLFTPTETEFYRIKAASTMIDFMKERFDPRLTVWFNPVDVQTLVKNIGPDVLIEKASDGKVKRYVKSFNASLDTSLYVGLKIALNDPSSYNNNNTADRDKAISLDDGIYKGGASNPFVSYLSSMYRKDTHPLVKSIFISASEVHFLLAEAASRGWINASAEEYFIKGISESLAQYSIGDGDRKMYNSKTHLIDAFDEADFMSRMRTEFQSASNKNEAILQQKWLASFATMEGWYDWRRTGYPAITSNILNGLKGQKIPLRYIYGNSELNYNSENTKTAISRLEPKENDQWSKMWLLQGTNTP